MAWIWMVPAAGVVLLWAISLGRTLSYPAPSYVPPSPQFMPPLHGDRRSRNVLLAIAHPDDESMFFAPTILFLKSKGHNIHIMCMSRGNADGLGRNIRKEELYHACDTAKIRREHVEVLEHPELQDGFHEKWDHGLVAELTMEQAQLWAIDTIVTFDSYGVSGHPNHKDVHHGICKFVHANSQGNVEAWELASLNILRKYSGPVDIWLSSLISFSRSKQSIYTLVNSRPSKSYERGHINEVEQPVRLPQLHLPPWQPHRREDISLLGSDGVETIPIQSPEYGIDWQGTTARRTDSRTM